MGHGDWQLPVRHKILHPSHLTILILSSVAQGMLYALLAFISPRFDYHEPFGQRPILWMLSLLTVAFMLHLLSFKTALRIDNHRQVIITLVIGAATFRGILLFSTPIQEIDIYRYLWDGAVVAEGVNPFRFSPEQVLKANADVSLPAALQRLVDLRDSSPPLSEILKRIHFGELTTVYPPASQAVFAMAALLTPQSASVTNHVRVMKAVLLLFDGATIGLVLLMLKWMGRHPGWGFLYAWNPLILKEFANSGHLDTIAVCLCTASICCVVWGIRFEKPCARYWPISAGVFLGLGTAAKLFPIILLPLITVVVVRHRSWKCSGVFAAATVIVSAIAMAPMFSTGSSTTADTTRPPDNGLAEFLRNWEINDLLFMLVVENIRPDREFIGRSDTGTQPWFVVIPGAWRNAFIGSLTRSWSLTPDDMTFLIARVVTLLIFLLVAAGLIRHATFRDSAEGFLASAFLTIAWFWALSPTLNPWYWCWAMPLLPFATSRAWMAVSGLLFLYYTRFYFAYHFPETYLFQTNYRGEAFYHFVIVPIEHSIWMGWLLIDTAKSRTVLHRTDGPSQNAV
ncbi:MAG: hypothetical protein O2955_21630 [Planctomycetota bacterium]|nr:hypothetical protein [Planctomycetota bacterium]MDA1215108.1 hypothetical protein [Planctomycetota bacterium]